MPSLSLVFPSDITLSAESSWKLQIDDIYQIDSGTRFGGELHTTPYSCQMYWLVLVADVKDRRVEIFALHSRRFSPSNLVLVSCSNGDLVAGFFWGGGVGRRWCGFLRIFAIDAPYR
jgi:hypothetical protein